MLNYGSNIYPNHEDQLRTTANELLRKMAERRVGARISGLPSVSVARTYQDGNFTFVVVETNNGEQFTGSAKFNPADIRQVKLRKKNGTTAVRYQSKYNPEAGELKALHRALEKILF